MEPAVMHLVKNRGEEEMYQEVDAL